jgi:hypothetical protein
MPTNWITPELLEILETHKPAYTGAVSEHAQGRVLKIIKQDMREHGKQGLPKELGKASDYLFQFKIYQQDVVTGYSKVVWRQLWWWW